MCIDSIEKLIKDEAATISNIQRETTVLESLYKKDADCQATQVFSCNYFEVFKDTHRQKASSNKTPAFTESMNMDIWVVGIPNQRFKAGSYNEMNFFKR